MQVISASGLYDSVMAQKANLAMAKRIRFFRTQAGLSQEALAQELGVHRSNIGFWENSGTPPRGEVIPALARALKVSSDELLGIQPPKPRKTVAQGRLQKVFEQVSKLPRRQQQKVIEMAEGFLALHQNGHAKGSSS